MEFQAVTGQLEIINGQPQAEGEIPGLLVLTAPAKAERSRQRDQLFVHLTLSGPREATFALAQDLLEVVSQRFFQTPGGVTSALRRAVLEANQILFNLNMSGGADRRVGALTCAVLRQQDLFVVQTGEAFAVIGRNFGIERLPAQKPDRITPLGQMAGVDIRFFHNVLQPGDTFLLTDPRLAPTDGDSLASALVDMDVESGLQRLADIVGPGSARLLFIEFADDYLDDLPDTIPITRPAPAPGQPTINLPTPQRNVEATARRGAAQTARGLSRATDGLADVLTRLRPPRTRAAEPTISWTWPVLLAVLIPIIVTVIVTGVYLQQGQGERMAQIKQEMAGALGLADQAGSDDEARVYYQEVLTLAAEADVVRLDDPDIYRMRLQAQNALDRIDGITRLNGSQLFQYPAGTTLRAVTLRDGLNGGLFTLDSANNLVFYHDTDESYLNLLTPEPEQIFFGGQSFGNHVVGNMIDMYWRPAGLSVPRDGLAVLDVRATNAALITYAPDFNTRSAISLGLSSEWQQASAITAYNERLYVLDPAGGVIWRYIPDGENLISQDGNRTIGLGEEAELHLAVDLAIYEEDASVAVVYSDGDIRYFESRSGGDRWTSNEHDLLDALLINPVAVKIVGRGPTASIFVADAATGTIYQLSRAGTVLTQYKATDASGRELFAGLTDFAVAETPLRIFFTVGNQLLVATQ